MSGCKYRILTLSIVLLVSAVNILFGGTTGKIAGKVVDKETGEPMMAVNVTVKGTTLGSATDIDGYYTILSVPPGVHAVAAGMVGYAAVTVNEVRVLIDQTSPVNISMVAQAIETGAVIVVAERNIVRKDVSTSVTEVQPEEIQSLPITSLTDVVNLQAGVEEGMMIRGGTSDQLLFQIDGVTQRDPRNNNPISSVALTSIQEVAIEKGGFNAEYGQVQSGIVNIVGREGNVSEYSGAIQVKYSPATPKYFGISVYDPSSMWNRPYLDPAVCWTGTENGAWDEYTQRQYPNFDGWNSVSQALLSDSNPNNDLSPAAAQRVWQWERRRRPKTDQPDYNIDASFGGPVPLVGKMLGDLRFFASYRLEREMYLIPLSRDDYKEYTWAMKVNSDIRANTKLMLSASTGKFYTVALNPDDSQFNNTNFGINGGPAWSPTDYFRSPLSIAQQLADQRPSRIFTDSWYSPAEVSHSTMSGKFTQIITSSTYYEAGFEYVNRKYTTGPLAGRDTTRRYEVIPGYFVDEAPFGWDPRPLTGIASDNMFFGGHSSQMRDSSKVSSYKLKFDLSSQITNEHLVKFGVEFSSFDLNLDYGKISPFFGDVNYVKERWKPYQLSTFLQDKIEMYGFIANVGLRVDLSNPNTEWVNVDPFDRSYFSGDYKASAEFPKKKADVDIAFSPRLGISHPITENSKLYFNYGHFKQLPSYQEVFRVGRGTSGALANFGDPNLVLAKTVAYELGYDHVLFNSYLLQVQAFYRDISDQQAYTQFTSDRKGIGYSAVTNNNYADIRGIEVTFRKSEGDWLRGFATYTYQVVTNGAFGSARINDDPAQQRILDQTTQTLYQQRPVPQPHARVSLTFSTPKDFGPDFSRLQPVGNWLLTLLADWRAGQYINYNPLQVLEMTNVNNVQCSDYFNIDLRVSKTFSFDRLDVTLLVEARNLLNTKILSGAGFYDTFDQQDYQQSLHLPGSSAYDNIPGDDRMGDYRKEGVAFQPIVPIGDISSLTPANAKHGAIYYDRASKKYYDAASGSWSDVESGRMQQILDDKAYIDMPNNTSFNFLNPRHVFFGINMSFNL